MGFFSFLKSIFAGSQAGQNKDNLKKAYTPEVQEVFTEKTHRGETDNKVTVLDERGNKILNDGLHPIVRQKVIAVIIEARNAGLPVDLFEGLRSFERQRYLFEEKKTTKAKPGLSWHNYGLAVDIVFKPKNKWSWSDKHDWKKLGEIVKKHGFIWGGDWGWDMAHCEYHPGFKKASQALKIFNKSGIEGVWKVVNQSKG